MGATLKILLKVMNTTIFILKVSLMNEEGCYDYVRVAGAFFSREDAWAEANKKIERMRMVWDNYIYHKHNEDAVYLVSQTGLAKWFEVIEMKVK